MLYGLPARSEAVPADPARTDQAFTAQVARWNELRGWDEVLNAGDANLRAGWVAWAKLSQRTLADERDTALGLSFGSRPTLASAIPDRAPFFHPFRTDRAALNGLLAQLTDGDGPAIGHVWVTPAQYAHYNDLPEGSVAEDAGKDQSLVIAIINGARFGGVEGYRAIASVSVSEDERVFVTRPDGAPSLRLKPAPHAMHVERRSGLVRLPLLSLEAFVHELGHTFGLGDEYSEWTGEVDSRQKFQARAYLNLTAAVDAVELGQLFPKRLAWANWPRIAAAGLVVGDITPDRNSFIVPLGRGHKNNFARGDHVHLRQRPLRKQTGVLRPATLEVTSDQQVEEQIVVRVVQGIFEPAEFPRGSIVFRPQGDALLMPELVSDFIASIGRPLNRPENMECKDMPYYRTDVTPEEPESDARAVVLNVPPGILNKGRFRWVGAFDGGMRYGCGVFHASPYCAMNAIFGKDYFVKPFCPVCTYILVDAIDPSLHGEIDRAYDAVVVSGEEP